MAQGFKDKSGKFHPTGKRMHRHYEGRGCSNFSREDREEPFEVLESILPTQQQLIAMQRQPRSKMRRQIGIVTGGVALGTAPIAKAKKIGRLKGLVGKVQKIRKPVTPIGTPDLAKGSVLGGIKGAISDGKKEVQQPEQAQTPMSSNMIVVDPATGRIGGSSGVLIDAFRAQSLISAREKNPNIIALTLFNSPLVALRPEKKQIVRFLVQRNK